MRVYLIILLVWASLFGTLSRAVGDELELQPENLSKIFYSQALRASWACRVERALKSPENERHGQFEALTEVAFRYWIYSRNKIIEKDPRFEDQLYADFTMLKNIPIAYLSVPIRGEILKTIPGFKWSLKDFSKVSSEFKEFILGLKKQN